MENCAMKKKRIDLDAPFHLFFFMYDVISFPSYSVQNLVTKGYKTLSPLDL